MCRVEISPLREIWICILHRPIVSRCPELLTYKLQQQSIGEKNGSNSDVFKPSTPLKPISRHAEALIHHEAKPPKAYHHVCTGKRSPAAAAENQCAHPEHVRYPGFQPLCHSSISRNNGLVLWRSYLRPLGIDSLLLLLRCL